MKYVILLALLVMSSGCAQYMGFEEAAIQDPVGFWYGLWHGIICSFAWIGSLFNEDISIYAIYNNGGWYDFGFICGVGGSGGVCVKCSKN